MNTKYLTSIDQIKEISSDKKETLRHICKKFIFRSNTYYQNLINWSDEKDPIKRIIIPDIHELDDWGRLDASNENKYMVVPGMQHKYLDTVLLLVTNVCGGCCRYCFRKRLFMNMDNEIVNDISKVMDYIKYHPEITSALLSGGDPFMLSTTRLDQIITCLREIEHVNTIRISTKMPAFNPYRIINDNKLLDLLKKHSLPQRRIYIMVHFDHPGELTDTAISCISKMQEAGAIIIDQTPIIRGINDDPNTLSELFRKLSFAGVMPYYIYQCRPTLGNKNYSVPLLEAYDIFSQARTLVYGLARTARFVMSHSTGKIEVTGVSKEYIFMRYHRAASVENESKIIIANKDPEAYWYDDLDVEFRISDCEFKGATDDG